MIHLDFKYDHLGGTPALRGGVKALIEFARDADFKPPYIGAPTAYDCMTPRGGEHSHVLIAIEEEAQEEWETYVASLALGEAVLASSKLTSVSSFSPDVTSPPWES